MIDKMREAFEVEFPPPLGIRFDDSTGQYMGMGRPDQDFKEQEQAYDQNLLWQAWKAAQRQGGITGMSGIRYDQLKDKIEKEISIIADQPYTATEWCERELVDEETNDVIQVLVRVTKDEDDHRDLTDISLED